MNLIGTIILFTFAVLHMWQNDEKKQITYNVILEKTDCAPTRRLRCSYDFVEVSEKKAAKALRRFSISFYMGSDRAEGKADAIERLDQFFKIKRKASSTPGIENIGTVGYTKPVKLRILGSKYRFSHKNGEKIVVDIAKR